MASQMRKWQNKILKNWSLGILKNKSVVNIGSGDDKDCEGDFYRNYFTGNYKTCDEARFKTNYNSISDIPENNFDCVLNLWVLEHVWDFKSFLYSLHTITKQYLIIAVPTKYNYHPAPNDYWRFTKDSMEKLLHLGDFKILKKEKFDIDSEGGLMYLCEVKK